MKKIFQSTKTVTAVLCLLLMLSACGGTTGRTVLDTRDTAATSALTTVSGIAGETNAPSATGAPASKPLTKPEPLPDAAYSWDPYCFDRLVGDYETDARLLADAILGYESTVTLSAEHAETVVDNIAFEFPPAALADFTVAEGVVTVTYFCNENEHARQIEAFGSAVNRALSILSTEDSEVRRATLLYNWVVENVSYFTTDYTEKEITAFSALAAGETICYGFADAFGYLLRQTGIEAHLWRGGTYTITGFSDHGWCYAKIDGAYYHFDPTWERSNYKTLGENRYTYFGLSDKKRFTSLSKTCVSGFGALEEVCDVTGADRKLEPLR
ncbi:MAG: hypothetical protein IJX76_06085 [Clostridia bacterium]|nr:hypothetical protein [Clostridia bacterium]